MERLQKVLARAGVASRRDCEALISAGRVLVNGLVVTELGTKVEPGVDVLVVDGRTIAAAPPPVYIMLNKPPGYVSTTDDPQGRPTVLDLLSPRSDARLFPVGRLDADSEGLLLLTNDGAVAERLTHPRYGMEKEYLVWVDGRPSSEALARLHSGIPLDGKMAAADRIEIADQPAPSGQTVVRIVVHEGRKHEVRRLCEAIGHQVRRLQRVRLGPLQLGSLSRGASRPLTRQEIAQLKPATAATPRPAAPARPPGPKPRATSRAAGPQPQRGAARRRPHAAHP